MRLSKLIHMCVFVSCYAYSKFTPGNVKDDGVALIREKRDNFIDRIINSIPFFHMSSPHNVIDEEQVDDDGDDDNDDPVPSSKSVSILPLTAATFSMLPTSVLAETAKTSTASKTSTVLSSVVAATPTPTLYSSYSNQIVSMSTDSVNNNNIYASSISTPGLAISPIVTGTFIIPLTVNSDSIQITNSISETKSLIASTLINSTGITISDIITLINYTGIATMDIITLMNSTDITASDILTIMHSTSITASDVINNTPAYAYPSSSSILSTMHSSVNVMPSTAQSMSSTPPVNDEMEPVIKMMIMSGESPMGIPDYGGRLPDERGLGDMMAKEASDDMDVKNMRFMYTSILVPVMSGLVGALIITFSIFIFKCIKRRKLKRVRYYGAKPGSGIYRLDQMSLLSDMSSDED